MEGIKVKCRVVIVSSTTVDVLVEEVLYRGENKPGPLSGAYM